MRSSMKNRSVARTAQTAKNNRMKMSSRLNDDDPSLIACSALSGSACISSQPDTVFLSPHSAPIKSHRRLKEKQALAAADIDWNAYTPGAADRCITILMLGGGESEFVGAEADALKLWFDQMAGQQRIQMAGIKG